jgi:hypothetical protein
VTALCCGSWLALPFGMGWLACHLGGREFIGEWARS